MNDKAIPPDLLKRLGLKIGHYTDADSFTGLTAFITEQGADLGIDIRGSNTGTFNTPCFDPKAAWSEAHAVVLTGGSTFGLSSAVGVMKKLAEQGIGGQTRAGIIPGATGAVIYDLAVGKNVSPSETDGMKAVENATSELPEIGNVGVGTGATLGKWFKGAYMKGGFGVGVSYLPNDIIVAAFTVVNALGDAVSPVTKEFYSESGGYRKVGEDLDVDLQSLVGTMQMSGNTTLTVIATNVVMDKNQLMKVAEFTHDGYARALHPIHTNMDGDVVFALSSKSSERVTVDTYPATVTDMVGIAAQDAVVAAINNAVKSAEAIAGIKSYSDIYGS
ncbi:MAG: P1 family peptidase [Candidatus Saccharibacteria bacterium]